MRASATSFFALLLALVLAPAASSQNVHDTGVVALEVFADGDIGTDYISPNETPGVGFTFDGENGLYSSTFMVGVSPGFVSGQPYAEDPEWATLSPVSALTPPFAAPYESFDTGYEAAYEDTEAGIPVGLAVTQRSYSRSGDAFVILEFTVENTSGGDLTNVFPGIFADMDVGNFGQNLGDYNPDAKLVYVFDNSASSDNYYGVAVLGDAEVSGWALDVSGTGGDDLELFPILTNGGGSVPGSPGDRRAVIGAGPYDIPAGESITAAFAFVAGGSQKAVVINALLAQKLLVAAEETTPAGTYVLQSAFPNPVQRATTLAYSLPEAEHVRVMIYDVLGRTVATLADETRPAGEHTLTWDASGIPAGVYFYRLEAGETRLTQRLTVTR